jgi:uncharacterized Zn finger protein (UPF0148 family)
MTTCPQCNTPLFRSKSGVLCPNQKCNWKQVRPDPPGAIGGLVGPKAELHKSPEPLGPAHVVIAAR